MAKKDKLTKQNKGIALNLTLELVPKLGYAIAEQPFKLIKPINEWYEDKLLSERGNATLMELSYITAASLKSAIDMAFYGVIYDIKTGELIKQETYNIDMVLELADHIVQNALAKY